jgi:hypothetical protein
VTMTSNNLALLLVSIVALSQCGCRLTLKEEAWHGPCMLGDVASLKSLVSSGMSPNARDENGNTPLTIALVNNQYEAADYLVSIGSRLDERNNLGKTVIQAVQSTRHSERDQAWLKKHEAIKRKP